MDKQIDISNISSLKKIDNINNDTFIKIDKLITNAQTADKRQDLCKAALSTISNSFKTAIDDIDNEIKKQKRIIQTGIKNIDEQIFALSQQKKQLKIEMAQFNKNGNDKIDKLSSHKLFIDKLLIKYKKSIQNKFNLSQIPFSNNPNAKDGKICTTCGHLATDRQSMNLHLMKHQNENKQTLSDKEWENYLSKLIPFYSKHIKDFQEKLNKEILNSKAPILPPLQTLNAIPTQIIMQNKYVSNAKEHNRNVLKNLHKNNDQNSFPEPMQYVKALKLDIGSKIDYRDLHGRYLRAKIITKDMHRKLVCIRYGINYEGWPAKFNPYSLPQHQSQRYALYSSISRRKLHRQCMNFINLKSGSMGYYFIEVKPVHLFHHFMYKKSLCGENIETKFCNQFLQWHIAEVKDCDPHSAQVQVWLYKKNRKNTRMNQWIDQGNKFIYWVHLDNEKECAPLHTHLQNIDIIDSTKPIKKRRQQWKSSNPRKKRKKDYQIIKN